MSEWRYKVTIIHRQKQKEKRTQTGYCVQSAHYRNDYPANTFTELLSADRITGYNENSRPSETNSMRIHKTFIIIMLDKVTVVRTNNMRYVYVLEARLLFVR